DFGTRLRSPRAQRFGTTWFDLIEHVLKKGVRVRLVLSDFDPVLATELHEACWRSKRQAAALAELVGREGAARFEVIAALHPARPGAVPWFAFLPPVLRKRSKRLEALNDDRKERQAIGLGSDGLPELHTVSHHQKLAVIDRRRLYVGGLDVNERRFDTPRHDRLSQQTWSDVQVMVEGHAAREAARHLDTFLDDIVARRRPEPCVHIAKTLSVPRRFSPLRLAPRTVERGIEQDHIHAFKNAHRLIHIETQFLRSRKIADALAQAGRSNPDLNLILILPALPEDVAFDQNRGLDARYGMALQADAIERVSNAFGARAIIASPVQPVTAGPDDPVSLSGSPVIHVHNKVVIVDDNWAMVGSANLNGRSMRWDTEVALRIAKKQDVDALRRRLYAHWWFDALPDVGFAYESAADWWREEIARNHVRRPEARAGFLVPHDPDKLARLHQPLPGVTEDIV
ncbi:MAG: phospholipase D-like domain-containing protein, partial [Tateyamaria sp.]